MKVGYKYKKECAGSFGSTHPFLRCLVLWTVYWYPDRSRIRVLLRLIPGRHHRFESCYCRCRMKLPVEAACRIRQTSDPERSAYNPVRE